MRNRHQPHAAQRIAKLRPSPTADLSFSDEGHVFVSFLLSQRVMEVLALGGEERERGFPGLPRRRSER